MGVFATRSPYRPNPIGLSSVKLIGISGLGDEGISGKMELIVSGADLLDGTPIYDIKPYLSFSDSHEDAKNGFAEAHKDYRLAVIGERLADEAVWRDIEYILSQDPRPAYQDDPEREYKLDYDGFTITFVVEGATVVVKKITKI